MPSVSAVDKSVFSNASRSRRGLSFHCYSKLFLAFRRGLMCLSRHGDCLVDIVANRPVAKRGLCKQRPFLDNGSVNTLTLLCSSFFNNARIGLRGPCRDVTSKGQSQTIVLYGRLWREDMSAWSWRISTVRSSCQGTAGEDIADCKKA
jgi:hypothetical protein